MRIAIISDIHGQIDLLQKCLNKIQTLSISKIICLGDIIEDNKEINHNLMILFKKNQIVCTLGNHDLATFDDVDTIPWEDISIDEETFDFFNKFPIRLKLKNYLFTHICPTFDREKTRLGNMANTGLSLKYMKNKNIQVCFVGHTHQPLILDENEKNLILIREKRIVIDKDNNYLINPGSICTFNFDKKAINYGIFDLKKSIYYPSEMT